MGFLDSLDAESHNPPMPIYEYRCTSCHHTLEALQKLSDAPLSECPRCGAALEKMISRTSFQMKGGGWYSEGYGGSKPSPSSKENGSSSGGESKDGKPEDKKAASGGCGSGCGCH